MRFSKALPTDAPYAPREAPGTKDARTLARELLGMSRPEFSAAFKGSPMKRAKRRGLARNAAVVWGNVGTADDIPVLEAALARDEPLAREHAARALGRIGSPGGLDALQAVASSETESVLTAVRSALAPSQR